MGTEIYTSFILLILGDLYQAYGSLVPVSNYLGFSTQQVIYFTRSIKMNRSWEKKINKGNNNVIFHQPSSA
jgi:hypothetical protein